jgi:hypothetical protein
MASDSSSSPENPLSENHPHILDPQEAITFKRTFPQFSRSDERDAAVLRAQVETLKVSLDDASLHLLRVQRENRVLYFALIVLLFPPGWCRFSLICIVAEPPGRARSHCW